jgi:hypothetical protein
MLRFLWQFQQVDVDSGPGGLQEPDPGPPGFKLSNRPHNTGKYSEPVPA